MKRLRRKARQEQVRKNKKFKRRAIATGTAVVITLGAGTSISKVLAAHIPDPHELAVSCDADADLLANREEVAIEYQVFEPDQNRNEIPDGVELAKRCAADINDLPWDNQAEPNETYKIGHYAFGLETCDICPSQVNMGFLEIVNPKRQLIVTCPFISLHYMEHFSFSYMGTVHDGRVDVATLLRALELRFPYDPNEHQLPLDYVVKGVGQLAPDANDLDNDLLANSEELSASYNLYNPDQNEDLNPDGIELAKQCSEIIDTLPVHTGGDHPKQTYKVNNLQWGLELCEICGKPVNMGWWQIVNPKLGLSINVYDVACHYMSHGSFSYSGLQISPPNDPFHNGRTGVALLVKILEMPTKCGDLGTIYLPGDLNKDCKADFKDFAEFADEWLGSTGPNEGECNR